MGAAQDAAKIGLIGRLLTTELLTFDVEIIDVTWAYGLERYVVRPIAGAGTSVVSAHRVTLVVPA